MQGSTVLYESTWGYDLVGNRMLEVHKEGGVTTTKKYLYNAADQLEEIRVYNGWIEPGNETSLTTMIYDGNGNLYEKNEDGNRTAYTWDFEDRLTGVDLPDGRKVFFEYCEGCGLAKRLSKTVMGSDGMTIESQTRYLWDGDNIIGEEDDQGNVVEYLIMPFSLMDNIISMKRNGQDYYYLTDAMGSVYQVVDGAGDVVNSYDYTAWGEIRGAQTTEAVANPFCWQTKPWDEEIALYYSRARYYEAGTGRFVAVDPITFVSRYKSCRSSDVLLSRYVVPLSLKFLEQRRGN